MSWRSKSLALIVLLPLAACQTTDLNLLTQTTERIGSRTDAQITAEVCRAWTPQSFDSRFDTQLTQDQAKELNRRRAAYCKQETEK